MREFVVPRIYRREMREVGEVQQRRSVKHSLVSRCQLVQPVTQPLPNLVLYRGVPVAKCFGRLAATGGTPPP